LPFKCNLQRYTGAHHDRMQAFKAKLLAAHPNRGGAVHIDSP
jgi:hypothetical protein